MRITGKEKTLKKDSDRYTLRLLSKYRLPIMGFATLWILIYHIWKPVLGRWDRLVPVENFIKEIGFCGVDIFLLVSGLGLVYAIKKYDLKTFYLRRFWHVYPPFFFACFGIGFFRGWGLNDILGKVFLIQFFSKNIYSYLWYVPAIMIFYLFFPLYYHWFEKAKNKSFFVIGTLVVWYIATISLKGILREDFYGITNRIPIFVIGILTGWLIENRNFVFRWWHWMLAGVLLTIGGVLAYLTTFKEMYFLVPVSNCCVPNFCMAIAICFILANAFCFLEMTMKNVGLVIIKIFNFFGGLSLPLYCIQEYIHTDIMNNPPTYRGDVLNLILFACIISAGIGLHYFCRLAAYLGNKIIWIRKADT